MFVTWFRSSFPAFFWNAARLKRFAPVLALLPLLGCATTSNQRDVPRPRLDDFQLRVTTRSEVEARYGKPNSVVQAKTKQTTDSSPFAVAPKQMITTATYRYAKDGEPAKAGVSASKIMAFYYSKKQLVGYNAQSSYKGDSSDFDDSFANRIQKGTTSRQEVLLALGEPAGREIYPRINDQALEKWVYFFNAYYASTNTIQSKRLEILLDDSGVVSDSRLTLQEIHPVKVVTPPPAPPPPGPPIWFGPGPRGPPPPPFRPH